MPASAEKFGDYGKNLRNISPILIDAKTKEKFESLDDLKSLTLAGRNSEMPPSIGFTSPRVRDP
jgi:hypothetical protein